MKHFCSILFLFFLGGYNGELFNKGVLNFDEINTDENDVVDMKEWIDMGYNNFEKMDGNGDSRVSRGEWNIKKVIFDRSDINRDGFVDHRETAMDLVAVFNARDRNSDGQLDRTEVEAAAPKIGIGANLFGCSASQSQVPSKLQNFQPNPAAAFAGHSAHFPFPWGAARVPAPWPASASPAGAAHIASQWQSGPAVSQVGSVVDPSLSASQVDSAAPSPYLGPGGAGAFGALGGQLGAGIGHHWYGEMDVAGNQWSAGSLNGGVPGYRGQWLGGAAHSWPEALPGSFPAVHLQSHSMRALSRAGSPGLPVGAGRVLHHPAAGVWPFGGRGPLPGATAGVLLGSAPVPIPGGSGVSAASDVLPGAGAGFIPGPVAEALPPVGAVPEAPAAAVPVEPGVVGGYSAVAKKEKEDN